jgi:Rho GTPase-activating protein 39
MLRLLFSFSDKMKIDKKTSPIAGHSANNLRSIQQINQLLKPTSKTLKSPSSHQSQDATMNSLGNSSKNSLRFSRDHTTADRKSDAKASGSAEKNRKKTYATNTNEMEYDNGNMSPLYTNWDQDVHEHLLPLQHYILEQAKLSGYRDRTHDTYDSDSIHSESHSEHSISDHDTGQQVV